VRTLFNARHFTLEDYFYVAHNVQVKQSKACRTHCAGMASNGQVLRDPLVKEVGTFLTRVDQSMQLVKWLCPLGDSIYADVTKSLNFLYDYDYKCTALQM
jgi:hypothetical protein